MLSSLKCQAAWNVRQPGILVSLGFQAAWDSRYVPFHLGEPKGQHLKFSSTRAGRRAGVLTVADVF